MVRETRHLWVGNLPDNIREDRIREHFKRYGRVQNVKLLGRAEAAGAGVGAGVVAAGANGSGGGLCATVAFMDIKSAAKAHNAEHVLDERTLTTEYYEPAAIPTTAGAPSAGSSPAGSGYSGSSSSVNSASTPAPASVSPASASVATAAATVAVARYHLTETEGAGGCAAALSAVAPPNWRGTNDSATEFCRRGNTPAAYGRYSRTSSTAPYATPPSNVERTPHHRWYGSGSGGGGESTPSTPGGGDGSIRRRRRSGSGGASHSSRSSSTSREPSSDSRSSTPTTAIAAAGGASAATPNSTTPSSGHNHRPQSHQWSSTASGRPLAICVRNLPTRSSDSSLKDGLYHEYKKHGKVVWVKVVGQNADRYAVVRFKKPSDVEKALEVSQDKLFFGCKISVAPHQSCDEDAESAKPYETDIDEFHPKATRTLFIGNLEKDVTQQQLREKFKHFGRIIEIDIKKGSGGGSGYAFCQYASIASVVDAIRAMDGEHVGGSRVKLGFGKPVATACVWIDGLTELTEKQMVGAVSRCGTATSVCVDRAAGAALVHFEQAAAASTAVRELRRLASQVSSDPEQRRLMVDYASRECQEAFYEQLEKHGGSVALAGGSDRLTGDLSSRYIPSTRHESLRYDSCGTRSRASSYGRSSSRTPRYTAMEHYDPTDYAADRRYRVFDDLGSSPQIEDAPYEDRLQSVVVSPHRARRHRHDSSSDEHKHSKDRHRGSDVRRSSGEIRNRSRSGSRSEHRRRGSDAERRRHRRRRDESGSRAGTPLCDELPEGPAPAEPRRPPQPRDRSHLPMSLPLPKFAAQVLRCVASHAPPPVASTAPASPPRPPSASSSSESSAPHSPSLEERIRSLDEKYEKWSGSRLAAAEAAERGRFRHRLLEIDINEVKPSEVVRSLLAKRSVFDEDSERLEGTVLQRPPSPESCARSKNAPRALQYPFPTHPPATAVSTSDGVSDVEERVPPNGISSKILRDRLFETITSECKKNSDCSDNSVSVSLEHRINSRTLDPILDDPRLNRRDKSFQSERTNKYIEFDNRQEKVDTEIRFRSSSIDKLHIDLGDKYVTKTEQDHLELERDPRLESERRRREFYNHKDNEFKINETIRREDKSQKGRLFPDLYKNDKNLLEHPDNSIIIKDECTDNSLLEILQDQNKSPKQVEVKCLSDNLDYEHNVKNPLKEEKTKDDMELELLEKKLSIELESSLINDKHANVYIPTEDNKNIRSKLFPQSMFDVDKTTNNIYKEEEKKEHCIEISEDIRNIAMPTDHPNIYNINICDIELPAEKEPEHLDNKKRAILEIEEHKDNTSIGNHKYDIIHNHKENVERDCNKSDCTEKNRRSSEQNQKLTTNSEDKIKLNVEREILAHDGRKNRKEKEFDKDKDILKTSSKNEKSLDKNDKDKRIKEDYENEKYNISKVDKEKQDKEHKSERDVDRSHKEKNDKDFDKNKNTEERYSKNEHRKDKIEKDKKRDHGDGNEVNLSKSKKDDHKYKHERHRKDHNETKRERKKDSECKSRKSSRDESTRELCRKDSTDSSASRTSHDSSKVKEPDNSEVKEEIKSKNKITLDNSHKHKQDKVSKTSDNLKLDDNGRTKLEIKEDGEGPTNKNKGENIEKQRHYSVDSPNLESKRKERLNSCSSLPSNIGFKRRMSSQDSIDSLLDDQKKSKISERRDSKESRFNDKHKTTKFNKCHFAKLLESKTKDDKKNQVKPPDEFEWKDNESKIFKLAIERTAKKSPNDIDEKANDDFRTHTIKTDGLQNHIDFLATLELRSSEEDEKQKALRKEMKEKKRIQQLQQIEELQKQQDALQQADLYNKLKDDKKGKTDEKKKEAAREKRMSTERKSREDKLENKKNKSRKSLNSSDTSDSDEPKKHSIFDIVDDEPTYISMYDKVKARSCKNMQKQEEEKRQEKIKAKFSQLKQSRAKREEKKRSSWDEDSDSDHDKRRPAKVSVASSSEDDCTNNENKKRDKPLVLENDFDNVKNNNRHDYFNDPSNEEDAKNKLSRKNFRTRIMSDTSDDEMLKSCLDKNHVFQNNMKGIPRESDISNVRLQIDIFSNLKGDTCNDVSFRKEHSTEHFGKNSIFNFLQNKHTNNYQHVKGSSVDTDDDYKPIILKSNIDFSSECESITSNKYSSDTHKKHKKKQKKTTLSMSEDETKNEVIDYISLGNELKPKYSDNRVRKHNKKDKRKDKIRESTDAEDVKDDKVKLKKNRKCLNVSFDNRQEYISTNIKREGKMEDIFGPLSDESDSGTKTFENKKQQLSSHDFTYNHSSNNCNDNKIKEKDEFKRKKDRKKKDKRYIPRDDENSLDVDAAGKAIEAQLFSESIQDNVEQLDDGDTEHDENIYKYVESTINMDKHCDGHKRECKERKKKKKRNKDDRQSRKDHQLQYHDKVEKSENSLIEKSTELLQNKELMKTDFILPNSVKETENVQISAESPSLPRLTDSPPSASLSIEPINEDTNVVEVKTEQLEITCSDLDIKESNSDQKDSVSISDNVSSISTAESASNSSTVADQNKTENVMSNFDSDIDQKRSENAVRSISEFDQTETVVEKVTLPSHNTNSTVDEKIDEKPRAIISQEETEDAVAALLGESFGGKDNSFGIRYNEVNEQPTDQIESRCLESEHIPEEDAEEMRQAVQNLNASEMELKPDTPMSDNDLLLIDTDNEEADDSQQDAIDRLPVNIIATNPSLTSGSELIKSSDSSILLNKSKQITTELVTNNTNVPSTKTEDINSKFTSLKREILQQATSTATPVITSWTLSNNKLRESHLINIPGNQQMNNKEVNENKATQVTSNIVHLKAAPTNTFPLNNAPRSIISPPNRVNTPYQVINPIMRPTSQITNMQPPTIKIPEPHILYHKQQGIVISPRLATDVRLQSPKGNDGVTSPRLTNMTLLSTSPQNINSVGLASPNAIQQRSPGHVTVVRMQQTPLSPIQAMNFPHGARAMVSPNRPNSVLVQTHTTPIHFNRLPVTPVLAPLSKQLNPNVLQGKPGNITNSGVPIIHTQKNIPSECRRFDQRIVNAPESISEQSKIILSPSSTNPTVMAQNRLISMQNAIHAGNINSGLSSNNKVMVNSIGQLNESREIVNASFKSDISITETSIQGHTSHNQAPIIHVAGGNQTTTSIIHNGPKSFIGINQDTVTTRAHVSNIIHTINSQRLLTATPITSVIQIDNSRCSPSVLSLANIRSPTVLTKLECTNTAALTTTTFTNPVMTPSLMKTSTTQTIRHSVMSETEVLDSYSPTAPKNDIKSYFDKPKSQNISSALYESTDKNDMNKPSVIENISKCETDFEELLKDNTNEIKVTNSPDKKLEINVGKTVTLISTNSQQKEETFSVRGSIKDMDCQNTLVREPLETDSKEKIPLNNSILNVEEKVEKIHFEGMVTDTSIDSKSLIDEKIDTTSSLSAIENLNTSSIVNSLSLEEQTKSSDSDLPLMDSSTKLSEDVDSWSPKDINIESVIKKVDSLCNEIKDNIQEDAQNITTQSNENTNVITSISNSSADFVTQIIVNQDTQVHKLNNQSKRGGRGMRGKKGDRNRDRVPTRQISKPSRGTTISKRGRGRGRIEKKLKTSVDVTSNNLPGDIYDFHEDSGDESKTESRPRLILTIKSPLSGQANALATSTLSISAKEQKSPEKMQVTSKEEKGEEFVSPSPNTRKSRRLQEKDVQRNTVDDVIEDVIKNATIPTKGAKDGNKKRPTRVIGSKVNYREKTSSPDLRKSPRGTKRTRDRSSSDASVDDSSDEKVAKKEDPCKDMKVPKLVENVAVISKSEPEPQITAKPSNTPVINSLPATTPTPIMKPPKKMISEISAKLASAFESTATPAIRSTATSPNVAEKPTEDTSSALSRISAEPDKQPYREYRDLRNPECAKATPNAEEMLQAAPAEGPADSHAGDMGFGRRLVDGMPGNVMPVGAMEAADARVQSPALPHRPPSTHRPTDRATPILIRAGESEMGLAGAAASSRVYRTPYAATASLPRGAHHPPPPQSQPPLVIPAHAAHKQLPLIGPHQHAGSRVTITSVPSVSPKSQMPLSADLVRSPPPAHQQTSPITPGDGMYPYFSHQQYQMFQQQFRVTLQENRTASAPYTRTPLEAEGSEAPTPPLELRRPISARVPRPAHSPSPADRLISAHAGRSPPPAHGGAAAVRLPAALPPPGPPGPLHASQVPREADSLQMLLRRYPVMWQGLLALKNDCAAVQMHFVHGNPSVAGGTLPRHVDGSTPPLRIAQRMRLEQTQLEQVHRKMKMENEHCMLLALPCGRDHMDVLQQSNNLTAGFITYLQRKQAAGIVNVAPPGHHQAMYTVHIFPSCDFANENLNRIAPDLMHRVADIAHLLIVIATV